jgi:hypothetical protein
VKRRFPPLLITAYFAFFIAVTVLLGFLWFRNDKPPEQPIKFIHKTHVDLVGLQCTFCHDKVEKSTFAGVPPVQKCMSCHQSVRTDSPEIQKLTRYWEEKKPVPWIKVYSFPLRNYIHFSHKRHIKAGLECANCHGEVRLMRELRRVPKLEMGWCVSCHRSKGAPTDCTTCHK